MRKLLWIALILSGSPAMAASNITALWANDGEDKVTQDDLRSSSGLAGLVNTIWDGNQINIFGARNEVVAFNVILEAGGSGAGGVAVSFNRLSGPSGAVISAVAASGNGVFDWTQRPIELFYVRYLAIKGLSRVSYDTYDENHIPRRLRRPGGAGTWQDRPDHDKFYPDIAVPLELVPTFTIAAKSNQSIWVDIYIPKGSPTGLYQGTLEVRENGTLTKSVPVNLKIYSFTLPDVPSAKTMLYFSSPNINHRYLGATWIDPNSAAGAQGKAIRDRHFLLAHRHRISLIGDSADDCNNTGDLPCPEWGPRLNGSLFTASNGYDGPGLNTGNNVYSIDTYGSWNWKSGGQTAMNQHTDAWETWFSQNSPSTEHFLYLIDESTITAQTETWANWILNNPGPGGRLKSMATIPLPTAAAQTPSLDIPTSTLGVGIASQWQPLVTQYTQDSRKRFFMYNGSRPSAGSTATEDDGVALRERAWAQYKLKVNRWYFWETTYYNEYQGGSGETNVFESAHTFGSIGSVDSVMGQTGWNYSNGDGVLFYPGTDLVYPSDSYGVAGPFASLRLKHWRRGIEDVDYLTLASAINPSAVQTLVNTMVPKAAWEYGVTDPNDPTYVIADVSWSDDPQVWEKARAQLAELISPFSVPPSSLGAPTFNPPAVLGLNSQITAIPPAGASITSYNWSFVPSTPPAGTGTVAASGPTVNSVTPGGTVSLGTLGLSLGYYQVSVTVTNSQGTVSPPATAYITLLAKALQARVYPNPWRANRNAGVPITFEQPFLNFTVDITSNYSGQSIKTLTAANGTVAWDLTSDTGSQVGSGTYVYTVKSPGQKTTRGKLAIIR